MSVCIICGEAIDKHSGRFKYCSKKCADKAELIRQKDCRHNTDWSNFLYPKVCPMCSKEFVPDKYSYSHQLYCSTECSRLAVYKRAVESGRKSINAKKHREKHKEKINARDLEYHNQERFGGNKYKVLERDNHTCQHCGNTKRLVVHHIDKSGQDEKPNNDMSNLITLCRSCHARIHQKVPWNKKEISKEDIIKALEGREVKEAAELLGITRKTLLIKRREYGLELRPQNYGKVVRGT